MEAAGKEEVKDSELKVDAVQNSEVKAEEQEDKDRDINMAESTSAAASPAPSTTTNSTATSRSTTPAPQQEKRTESVDPTRVMFVVRGSISGHVIELNERLLRRGTSEITDPLVIQTMLEKVRTPFLTKTIIYRLVHPTFVFRKIAQRFLFYTCH